MSWINYRSSPTPSRQKRRRKKEHAEFQEKHPELFAKWNALKRRLKRHARLKR